MSMRGHQETLCSYRWPWSCHLSDKLWFTLKSLCARACLEVWCNWCVQKGVYECVMNSAHDHFDQLSTPQLIWRYMCVRVWCILITQSPMGLLWSRNSLGWIKSIWIDLSSRVKNYRNNCWQKITRSHLFCITLNYWKKTSWIWCMNIFYVDYNYSVCVLWG